MTTAANPLDAVQQLQRVVGDLAPKLQPQVLPKGTGYGLDLLMGLCATDEQRVALRSLVQLNKPADAEDGFEPFIVGAFDAEKKVFSVDKVQWLSEEDALVHQFPRFLELQLESPEEAMPIIKRFLDVNGHDDDNLLAVQQCFNAAFSLQTILRAFPRPPIAIQGEVMQVTSSSSVEDAFAALFPSVKKTSKKTSSGTNKQNKSKKRKNKQVN